MSSLSSLQGSSGKLLRRIHRACRPTLDEPNIALNLEICDLVNTKPTLPREACITVVKLINSRDPQVSELALTLLDYLVKNCGYPVHLQISRKEFLNELVKRFPERPPPAYSRTQRLILGTISEWVHTICKTSRYKDDLTYIKDMYRLLKSKGYDFPAVKKDDAAVLNPSDAIKSIEEIQREERLIQSAKLQELIRRGRPQDLKEANDLMKIMSGFKEDESLEETKQKLYDDLEKLNRKIDLLNEMLDNATNSGVLNKNDDTLHELISTVKVSQPRVQKIIEEEQDSNEMNKLLLLNDKINNTLIRIGQLKGEDVSQFTNSGKAPVSMNLIDFDDDNDDKLASASGPTTDNKSNTKDAINDLLSDLGGLTFNDPSNSVGAINLLGSNEPPQQSKPLSNLDILSGFNNTNQVQTSIPPTPINNTIQSQNDPFGFDFNSVVTAPSSQPNSLPKLPLFEDANISVEYTINQKQPVFDATFYISNKSLNQLTNVQLSLAVTKSFELTLKPASSLILSPGSNHGITQNGIVKSKTGEPFNSLKLKYKITYNSNNSPVESIGVATITF
ncbi:hypothetical protein CANINC_002784 [Pichia inconspicua]|uniref:VHS domain-containing protein n=1 Tax=Pichia inconspicua TaxID=52247 RepID=A0A4T0X0C8_9ASCO|nr:hypothetical protein CANINC_002784 [[Candida] inconspicua]